MPCNDATLDAFTAELGSKSAIPGGGGASALVGAIGASLAAMVGNLTVGKKKYADVEAEAADLIRQAEEIRLQLLALADADAEVFEPLSKAYAIPNEDPTRDAVMEECLKRACSVPMDIMRTVAKAVNVHERMERIGSVMAISDVGVGIVCCKAALQGASLNVFINTKSMKDKAYAEGVEREADDILRDCLPKADAVHEAVVKRLRS